jgi:hypothetical protein
MRAYSFDKIEFEHCPREENVVAYQLPKHAYDLNSVISWEGDPPNLFCVLC